MRNRQRKEAGLLPHGWHYETCRDETVRIFNIEYNLFSWNRQPRRGTLQLNARFSLKIHDKKRVEALRAAGKAGIKALDELRDKTADPGFHEMLVPPGHWFADIESFFISQLDSRDNRTPVEEASWLNAAELNLDMASQRLKQLQEMFNTSGPDIKVIG